MQKALAQLDPNGENRLALRDLQQNAIDIKAQATGFGYPLLGDVAALLIEYLHDVRSVSADNISVIDTTVSAMRAIYAEKRTGDGGAMGVELIESLKSLMREGPVVPRF